MFATLNEMRARRAIDRYDCTANEVQDACFTVNVWVSTATSQSELEEIVTKLRRVAQEKRLALTIAIALYRVSIARDGAI
jgi:hypothetical protein